MGEAVWTRVNERMCLMATHVGYVPLPWSLNFHIKDFAVRAVNSIRAVKKCGEPVRLLPSSLGEVVYPKGGIMGRAVQLHFHLPMAGESYVEPNISAGGYATAELKHVVYFAVESFARWDSDAKLVGHRALLFLGSHPAPCEVGKLTIFDAMHASAIRNSWLARAPSPAREPPEALLGSPKEEAIDAYEQRMHFLEDFDRFTEEVLKLKGLPELPSNFDLRQEVPECALPVQAQGRCAGGWALAAIGAFEKQACYLTHGVLRKRLSAQHLLDCAIDGVVAEGCLGGRLESAYKYLFQHGAAPEECAPWVGPPGRDLENDDQDFNMPLESRFPPEDFKLQFLHVVEEGGGSGCKESLYMSSGKPCPRLRSRMPTEVERATNVWPSSPFGVMALRGDRMIQSAILAYGAVATAVEVYPDFLDYRGGVYRRADVLGPKDLRGVTAVQLLGWGVQSSTEGDLPYWLGENTFGVAWGLGGYFRWIRGQDHLGVERCAFYGLVAGLAPLGSDRTHVVDSKVKSLDYLDDLESNLAQLNERIDAHESFNWWLMLVAMSNAFVVALAVTLSVRFCLCSRQADEE